MDRTRRRAQLALTLAGIAIAIIGLCIWGNGTVQEGAAEQAAIDATAADWGEVLGYDAGYEARSAALDANLKMRVAEENQTFGIVLMLIGGATFGSRWAIRPKTHPRGGTLAA